MANGIYDMTNPFSGSGGNNVVTKSRSVLQSPTVVSKKTDQIPTYEEYKLNRWNQLMTAMATKQNFQLSDDELSEVNEAREKWKRGETLTPHEQNLIKAFTQEGNSGFSTGGKTGGGTLYSC